LEKCNFVKDTHTRKLCNLPISGKRVTIHFFAYLHKEVDRCRRAMRRAFPTDEAVKHLKWALLKLREKLSEEEPEGLLTLLEDPRYELLRRTWQAGNEIAEWEKRQTAKPNRFVQRFADFF